MNFLNRFAAGTVIPRVELDFIPGVACASHFMIIAATPPEALDDVLAAGRAMQRFWLTATSLGLLLQPEMTPLIFSAYVRDKVDFSANKRSQHLAEKLAGKLARLASPEKIEDAVFMGRLGFGSTPGARSIRIPLEQLMLHK